MSYGLRIWNPSSELVISDVAHGLHAVHKATFVSLVQPTGTATATTPGRVGGYSTYTSNHPGDICCAVDLPVNKNVGLLDVSGGAGAWTIKAYCGDTPDADGFDVQYALDVWVYGSYGTMAASYGLAMFNASAALAQDLSRDNPLYPRAFVTDTGSGIGSIPALSRAVAVGVPNDDPITNVTISTNTHYQLSRRGMWRRFSDNSLGKQLCAVQKFRYFGPDLLDDGGDTYPASAFIVEGTLLP